ncbi:DUF4349 domain-containing protein [Chitinophaga agri]|uniref:DUF4349 domain-containing protein n=1 Tax=Chitinophaga agri TaxID=2703787 RepID=A0A6B9ZQK5_9BACT|nr:DUF4349 domain-containing protein [Chitinophaga agri]QHS63303.1 DUF4349 domain-containing protein [Chitinophaga agri]
MRFSLCYMAPMALLAISCSAGTSSYSEAADTTTIAVADSTTFSNDITSLNSPSRKRVRTADVRCRVSNVFNTVSALEHVVAGVDGIIAESNMQNYEVTVKDVPYATDSLRRIQLYTPVATMTLRVPAAHLDSVVHTLTSMATFIEFRTLKDEDKTLSYLSNSMKNDGPKSPAVKPTPFTNTVEADAYRDEKHVTETDRKIANMAILDDVHYATFTVQVFQPQMADQQVIVNPERITRTGFGTQIRMALRTGLESIGALFILLIACWPYLLLLALGFYFYHKGLRKVLRKKLTTL